MSIETLLENYPPEVARLVWLARAKLLKRLPQLQEDLDLPSRILIYRVAPGMKGIVFTLSPSKKGVRLRFYRGRELLDPAGLMEGSGKVHTTISLSEKTFNNADFDQAAEKAHSRVNSPR